MNLSDETNLEIYNAEKISEYAPAIVYSAIVIILGIAGNIISVTFFGFKVKENITNTMITALAITDLINSFVLCDEIIELCYTVVFKSVFGCKLMYFINHWLVFCSSLLLGLIAVDRYRRICHPFSWQFSKISARLGIAGVVFASCALSVRDWVILDVVRVNITSQYYNKTMRGYYCTHSNDQGVVNVLVRTFLLLDLVCFVVAFPAMAVLYCIITKTVWQARNTWKKHDHVSKCFSKDANTSNKDSLSNNITQELELDIHEECTTSSIDNLQSINSEKSKLTKYHCGHSFHAETKVAIMMIAVTVGSIISFVPYFIVNLVVKGNSTTSEQEFNVGIQIALRSFMLNSSINPYIMAMFNTEFSNFVKMTLYKCLPWKKFIVR